VIADIAVIGKPETLPLISQIRTDERRSGKNKTFYRGFARMSADREKQKA